MEWSSVVMSDGMCPICSLSSDSQGQMNSKISLVLLTNDSNSTSDEACCSYYTTGINFLILWLWEKPESECPCPFPQPLPSFWTSVFVHTWIFLVSLIFSFLLHLFLVVLISFPITEMEFLGRKKITANEMRLSGFAFLDSCYFQWFILGKWR